MFKKSIVILLLLSSIGVAFGQKNTKEQGLLWQISGNGLSKPSYLFGTMHVSKKMVFHLGEPWFNAIDSVEMVALEMAPETWLGELIESDLINASMTMAMQMQGRGGLFGLYKDPYRIGKDRLTYLTRALNEDPEILNGIMYRMQEGNEDREEDSWLDMYIYQTGKKLGKATVGLETFEESMLSAQKSSMPDVTDDKTNMFKKYGKDFDLNAQLETAYRNGDLTLLDSIYQKLSSKNTIKYLINERNERFVQRMDSIMKTKSLFSAMGAAHLGGEKGVISLLRAKGYKVSAIKMGERDANRKKKLEETVYAQPFQRYYSNDSIFSLELPERPQELLSTGASKLELSADLVNSIHYTINRIKTYAAVLGESKEQTWHMVDSLLYDNVLGKILEQKETSVNGCKAVDLKTQARNGHIILIRVVQLADEVLILKVSAPSDKVIAEFGERFIKSLEVGSTAKAEWYRFSFPDKTFSVELPQKPVFYGKSKMSAIMLTTDVLASDEKSNTDFYVTVMPEGTQDYADEDTFELSTWATDYAKANNYKEIKRQVTTFKGYNALKVNYKAGERNVEVLYILQNMNYYAAIAYYNKPNPSVTRFFESIQFGLPEYSEFYEVNDSTSFFTYMVPVKPKQDILSITQNLFLNYAKGKEDTTGVVSTTKSFSDKLNNETITVETFKYSRYYTYSSEADFKRLAKIYASNFGDYTIKNEKEEKLTDGLQLDFYLSDTNTVKSIRCRVLLKNQTKYVITAHVDAILGESRFVTTFFDSFKPIDSLTGKNVFANKADLVFKDLAGTDTILVHAALAAFYDMKADKKYIPEYKKLLTAVPAQENTPVYFKCELYRKLGETKDISLIPFLKNAYTNAGDTSDYQFAILTALRNMKSADGMQAYKELVLNETPFGKERSANSIFMDLRDSIKLSASLFPDLFQLLSIEEYKDGVYDLLADMLDSNVINPSIYKDRVPTLLNEAKITLKKVLSDVGEKSNYFGGYGVEENLETYNKLLFPFIDQSNVKAHFDKIMATDNKAMKYSTMMFILRKTQVADTALLRAYAADDEYRIKLYKDLNKLKKPNLFPAQYKTHAYFAKAILIDDYGYSISDKDSIQFIETRKIDWKGKKGYCYIYKYKADSDYNDEQGYKFAFIGVMPSDGQLTTENDFKLGSLDVIDTDEAESKQLEEAIANVLKTSRPNNYMQYFEEAGDEEYNYKYMDDGYYED